MEHSVAPQRAKRPPYFAELLTLLASAVLLSGCAPHTAQSVSVSGPSVAATRDPSPPASAPSSSPPALAQKQHGAQTDASVRVSLASLHDLERTAKSHPSDAKALARYGSALVEAGKVPEGIASLRRAVALAPDLTAAWHNLAFAAAHQSWFDIAAEAYSHVVAARPENAGEWVKLGYALLPLGRFDEAERAFQHAARLQPDSTEVLVALASTEFAFFHYESAIANLRRAAALNPRSDTVQADLASIEWEHNQQNEAESAIRVACTLAPTMPGHALFLARMLVDSPDPRKRTEAETVLHRVWDMGGPEGATPLSPAERAQAEYLMGVVANRDGQKAQAIAHWRQSYALDPNQPIMILALAHALTSAGGAQAREGRKLLDLYQHLQAQRDQSRKLGQLAETHPNDAHIRYRYGKLLLDQGNFARAIWELHEAVRLRPDDRVATRTLALALRRVGRTAEAEALGNG